MKTIQLDYIKATDLFTVINKPNISISVVISNKETRSKIW